MAHYAQLDENNIVTAVHVIDNNQEADKGEENIIDWLKTRSGGITWVKTSYNTLEGSHLKGGTPLRKNYAGLGYTYDAERDAFIPPQPHASWTLNETTCQWDAPTPYPDDARPYYWDESEQKWKTNE